MRGNLRERFDAKFEVSVWEIHEGTPCWDWTAASDQNGYGRIGVREFGMWLPRYAHRVAYELYTGELPEAHDIDHLCRRPGCVQPAHLEAVPHNVNCQRGLNGDLKHLVMRPPRQRPFDYCVRGHRMEGVGVTVNANGGRICLYCRDSAARRYDSAKTIRRLELSLCGDLAPRQRDKQRERLRCASARLVAVEAERARLLEANKGKPRHGVRSF
jgi:hypothetical protein